MNFSGLLKFKSVDKQFTLAISAYNGNCILAIFKDKQIIDRFSIPTHMRFILKKYLKKIQASTEEEIRLPVMKVSYNKKDNIFSPDIKIILNKNKKYKYTPFYIEIYHKDLLHMNFPITIPSGVSINEERSLPIPANLALSYVIDYLSHNLEIAIFLSKMDSQSSFSQKKSTFTSI